MSHVELIQCEVTSISALRKAAKRLGGELVEGATTYKWWGRHEGDYPIPEGLTRADLGTCDGYKIVFPRHLTSSGYEVGLKRMPNGTYRPIWDFIDSGLSRTLGGSDGGKLIQAYAIEVAKEAAEAEGLYDYNEQVLADGSIQLVINDNRSY